MCAVVLDIFIFPTRIGFIITPQVFRTRGNTGMLLIKIKRKLLRGYEHLQEDITQSRARKMFAFIWKRGGLSCNDQRIKCHHSGSTTKCLVKGIIIKHVPGWLNDVIHWLSTGNLLLMSCDLSITPHLIMKCKDATQWCLMSNNDLDSSNGHLPSFWWPSPAIWYGLNELKKVLAFNGCVWFVCGCVVVGGVVVYRWGNHNRPLYRYVCLCKVIYTLVTIYLQCIYIHMYSITEQNNSTWAGSNEPVSVMWLATR